MANVYATHDEAERLKKLESYKVLDTLPEQLYDDITHIASQICQTPISLISLVDKDRQWFKSKVGLDAPQTPRDLAFCSHAIHGDDLFYIPNAKQDDRFKDNPIVTGEPHVIFYAGAPIITPEGYRMGTLCVIDNDPRELDEEQKNTLLALSRQVASNLELRVNVRELGVIKKKLEKQNDELSQFAYRTSHDLKAPITASKRLIKYVISDIANKQLQEATDNGHKIENLMQCLENLVADITSLVKADIKQDASQIFTISELLQEIQTRLDLIAQENDCEIITQIRGADTISFERGRLCQILENLISNGIKYSDKQKTKCFVKVVVSNESSELRISVDDNGVGIPLKNRADFFKMFKRFHPKLSYGSGLGASIVKKHVDFLSGSISFSSSDQGTSFDVSIPLQEG